MSVELDGANNVVKTDTVSEVTSANGVTIDGLNIKDSKIVTANSIDSDVYIDGSIDTAHIADGQVTIGKLATAVLTGATDIGEAIVDADLFLVDNGAGGTLRKTTAARLKTYTTPTLFGAGVTDVLMDATNFVDSLLIQAGSNGSAPTTGTLNGASNDIGIGHDVFKALTSGTNNVAIGGLAADGLTTGSGNTAIGYGALSGVVTGDSNVAIGTSSGIAVTSGTRNVFVGIDSGKATTDGPSNVYLGYQAGFTNISGDRNIAIGDQAVYTSDTENDNIGIGKDAMGGSIAGGEFNVGVGNYAGNAVTSGDNNTFIGHNAGDDVADGSSNTFVGKNAGNNIVAGTGNVHIGVDVVGSAGGNDFSIALGNGISVAANDFSFGKASNVVTCDFDADAAFSRSSDIRKKKNVKDSTLGLDFINDLRPVTFNWKPNNEFPKDFSEYSEENMMNLDSTMHGMIAQEVKTALDKSGVNDFGGWKEDEDGSQRLSQELFVYPLIKAVQELTARVKELEVK